MKYKRALKEIIKLTSQFSPTPDGGYVLVVSGFLTDKKTINTIKKLNDEMTERGEY